ncbi:helix-turn-helix transcriptional regulator [Streptomyces mirabilis]|uniref:helix-turn-helix transcriptional regulator n=1 Tax=Streptomyces mirabilis TaxID=68239 RepID=UPI0036DF2DE1
MITPENAVRLARIRRAQGGETWLSLRDAALYSGVRLDQLAVWARLGKLKRHGASVDLGEVLEVRDASTARVPDCPLTYRALALFRLAANGYTTAQIAEKSGVTIHAVHSALQAGTDLLGARNRTHAVALLMAAELISSAEVVAARGDETRQVGVAGGTVTYNGRGL